MTASPDQGSKRGRWPTAIRTATVCAAPIIAALPFASAHADSLTLPPISIGAGIRADYTNTSSKDTTANANDFNVDDVRLYISGAATSMIKFTFNTEYTGSGSGAGSNKVEVMDAIARFEYSPQFNIWAGRFLPPSDRANLYGPFYANHWGVYRDGVQDGYANVAVGRDNGAAYWGDFGGLKVSAGLFDVPGTSAGSDKASSVILAGRVQYDFWDKETGYWLNSTYYGDKNLLAIGAAGQSADGDTSYSFDFLMEKNVPGTGVFTVESEYAKYKGLTGGGFDSSGDAVKNDGEYALVSYLFPQPTGPGKIQLLGKYAQAKTDVSSGTDPKMRTSEFDLGYIVKQFNVRGYLFYIKQNFSDTTAPDASYAGVGIQVQI